jgi:hypothetical protein
VQGSAVPGGTLTATLPGFGPDTDVKATLHSDPVDLGTVHASAGGVATVTFTVPLDFTGTHTVEGVGTGPNGQPVTVRATFVVSTAATVSGGSGTTGGTTTTSGLAFTGASSRDLASAAVLMIAVGLLLLDARYRRRRSA